MKNTGIRKLERAGEKSEKHWRIRALLFFILAAAAVIAGRLYALQVVSHEDFRVIAENQHHFSGSLEPKRGEIYLREKNSIYPLAINRDLQMVYAVPKEISDRKETSRKLAEILSLDAASVEDKISDPNDMFEIIKRKLSEEEAREISDWKRAGVYLMSEKFRFYPAGELAAHVVGFVGSDGQNFSGRYGVEAYWEKKLKGSPGVISHEKDTRGGWISTSRKNINPARDGTNLILTIDHTAQYETEKILRETFEKHKANGATAIVMEPKTGKIIALANLPSFNPNEYNKTEDISFFLNPAVSSSYECGSVFKPITMAMGIEEGKVSPDTVYTDVGAVKEAGYVIKNSDGKSHGKQTMTQVLEKSLNTGVIFVEKQIGNKKFAEYAKRFGFGEKTGVDLASEISGNINNLNNLKSDIQFFTASFGQGISMTPLQLINAFAAVANGGNLMKPQIVEKITYVDGREEKIEPQVIRRVISEKTAQEVGRMLRNVVVNGHGKKADVPGYLVGGKTGTAQVPKKESKGYEDGINIGSFVGYAPIDDPKFVVLVKVENPQGVVWAESSAAPAVGKIMKFLMDYYKIEPTEPIDIEKLNWTEKQPEQIDEAPILPITEETKKKNKKT